MRFLVALFFALMPVAAFGQGAVLQAGPVVPGHYVSWTSNGRVQDAGNPVSSGPYLPLVGGTLTGPLTFHRSAITDNVASGLGYDIQENLTFNLGAGASGLYFTDYRITTVTGNPSGGFGSQVWANLDQAIAQTDGTANVWIVDHYMQSLRPAGFGTPSQVMWVTVEEVRDRTGLPTSQSGRWIGKELDMAVNGPDDVTLGRQGLVITEFNGDGVSAPAEVSCALCIFNGADGGHGYYSSILFASPARDASIDMRNVGNWPVTPTTDGTALWLRTGLKIDFDTPGLVSLSTDTQTLFSSVPVRSPSGFYFNETGTNINSDGVTMTASVPWRLPASLTRNLPSLSAAHEGSLAWATDCKENGETAPGTGCVVVLNHVGVWVAIWSGVAPTT